MKEFTYFIAIMLALLFAAFFFMGSEDFGSFKEISASLQEQVKSVHE